MERLFATEKFAGRALHRFYAFTVFAGICLVLYYRATRVPPSGEGRAAWLGMLAAELWYSFYWVVTQSVRWCPVRRRAFKDRLAARTLPAASDLFTICNNDRGRTVVFMAHGTVSDCSAMVPRQEKARCRKICWPRATRAPTLTQTY